MTVLWLILNVLSTLGWIYWAWEVSAEVTGGFQAMLTVAAANVIYVVWFRERR